MDTLDNKKNRELSYDEKKASEAAFQGLPPDPRWTASARHIYDEIRLVMRKQRKQCVV